MAAARMHAKPPSPSQPSRSRRLRTLGWVCERSQSVSRAGRCGRPPALFARCGDGGSGAPLRAHGGELARAVPRPLRRCSASKRIEASDATPTPQNVPRVFHIVQIKIYLLSPRASRGFRSAARRAAGGHRRQHAHERVAHRRSAPVGFAARAASTRAVQRRDSPPGIHAGRGGEGADIVPPPLRYEERLARQQHDLFEAFLSQEEGVAIRVG